MTLTKRTLLPFLSALAMIFSPLTYADMSLDSDQSVINFVSVKKGTVAETHTINKSSGTLTDKGELKISLDLSSVDTKIEVRDQRMKEHLFETLKFANATISANLGELSTSDGISQVKTEATLELHGVLKPIKVEVMVMRSGDTLMAASTQPILITAADYGLEGGVAILQKGADFQ